MKLLKPLARLQGFPQRCHGSIHVLWFKGHACLHHQDAAVAHCVVHALALPEAQAVAARSLSQHCQTHFL